MAAAATTIGSATSALEQAFVTAPGSRRGLTWAQIRLAALFWLGWGIAMSAETMAAFPQHGIWEPIATAFYDTFVVTCLLLIGIAAADVVAPSTRPHWMPYAIAAVFAAPLGAVLIVYTEPALGLHCCWTGPRPPDWVFIAAQFGTNLLVCSLASFGYYHRRRALNRVTTLRRVQLERSLLAKRAFEVRLQAMQARVEPQFLFNTLAQVERLYEIDTKVADRMLDDLIVYLRAALPQLRETTSTLAREVALAKAYVSVVNGGAADPRVLDVGVTGDGWDARMPPMVLLPLLEFVIGDRSQPAAAGGSIRVAARVEAGKLRLTLAGVRGRRANDQAGTEILAGIRERLTALYGAAAILTLDTDEHDALRVVAEIPHECIDDRDHR